jgi:hypothetical protein
MSASEKIPVYFSYTSRDNTCYLSPQCKFFGAIILLMTVLAVLALLSTPVASPKPATIAGRMAAIKSRVPTTTTVVYTTTVATTTTASLLTPTPTHTSAVVHSGLSSGAIVGILFAVLGGILLAVILIICVALRDLSGGGHAPGGHSSGKYLSERWFG